MSLKYCPRGDHIVPVEEFTMAGPPEKRRFGSYCKACHKERNREYNKNKPKLSIEEKTAKRIENIKKAHDVTRGNPEHSRACSLRNGPAYVGTSAIRTVEYECGLDAKAAGYDTKGISKAIIMNNRYKGYTWQTFQRDEWNKKRGTCSEEQAPLQEKITTTS
jgi:hypothetical protein